MGESQKLGVKIKKVRRRLGKRMGVAVLDADYRQVNEQGILDLERTIVVLKTAERLIDAALASVTAAKK
jgi:hypothetical protein